MLPVLLALFSMFGNAPGLGAVRALDNSAAFCDAAGMNYARYGNAGVYYPGGKNGSGVYQRIINLMPPHRVYIEPFLGGGAIYRLKRPAEVNIGVEIDPVVFDEWAGKNTVCDDSGRERPNGSDPAHVGSQCGSVGGNVGNLPSGGPSRVVLGDGARFLKEYHFQGDELVYCDPPYLAATCSTRIRYKFKFSEDEHMSLLRCIRKLPCPVLISGYWSQMYDSALKGWNSIHFETMTRGRKATEWVWFNYAQPTALHDYRYVGENYRDRQRIKRKKASWTGKLRKMSSMERQALLSVMAEEWGDVSRSPIVGTAARIPQPNGALVDVTEREQSCQA